MGLLQADADALNTKAKSSNKVAPASNEQENIELTQLSDGERRLKQLLKEEDDKRKRALIRIIVLIFLVALIIAICIPVTIILTNKGNSKGENPTPKTNSTLSTPTPATTATSKCIQSFPSTKPLEHWWNCSDGSSVGSSCSLSCLKDGYIGLKSKSFCLSNGNWSSGWTECVPVDACRVKADNCSEFATCQRTGIAKFTCSCNLGYAGNGVHCGNDTDADGIPDLALNCTAKQKECMKDNCMFIPNSGQENSDGDERGDACDSDDDNDGILDPNDNCPLVKNLHQIDNDTDGIGDACDNCPRVNNTDQVDTNLNGIGDACDADADSDGIVNARDNCVLVYNPDQMDIDADGIGNACDNCVSVVNKNQADDDDDLIGDACQYLHDSDFDGIADNVDNCVRIPNGDQTDTDSDAIGDPCDDDKDADTIPNISDNCPLVPNPDQSDSNKDGIGDKCEDDDDGDGVRNELDDFPQNSKKRLTDFRVSDNVIFDGKGTAQEPPKWFQFDKGKEILQTVNGNPGALLGRSNFGDLVFTGTLMIRSPAVGTTPDDDYVGLIFGFQSNMKFYVCSWKKKSQSYNLKNAEPYPRAYGRKGISLKKFHSSTGPGIQMRDALWETGSSANQSTLLWHDGSISWQFNTSYQWKLQHNPQSGSIRIRWYQGTRKICDSGIIVDKTWRGGRVGVFVFSQENVYFSALKTRSAKSSQYALELNGESSYLNIGSQKGLLNGKRAFAIDFWTRVNGARPVSCKPPRKIDFGNYTHPRADFLTQDATDEREWDIAGSFFPNAGLKFDHSTTDGNGNLIYFNGKWMGSGPYVGDRARLLTPWFPANRTCKMTFYLFMVETNEWTVTKNMGSFQIEVRGIDGIWKQVMWLRGNQGTPWIDKGVILKPTIEDYEYIQVRFTATRGRGSRSTVGIDDIEFGSGCGATDSEICDGRVTPLVGSSSGNGLFVFLQRGKLVGGFSPNETVQTNSSSFKYGEWNHVALSFNDSNNSLEVSVNGQAATSKQLSVAAQETVSDIFIGRQGRNHMKGFVDEIRLWKGSSNVAKLFTLAENHDSDDLIADYRLNKGEGDTAYDEKSRRSNAKINNATWMQPFLP